MKEWQSTIQMAIFVSGGVVLELTGHGEKAMYLLIAGCTLAGVTGRLGAMVGNGNERGRASLAPPSGDKK